MLRLADMIGGTLDFDAVFEQVGVGFARLACITRRPAQGRACPAPLFLLCSRCSQQPEPDWPLER